MQLLQRTEPKQGEGLKIAHKPLERETGNSFPVLFEVGDLKKGTFLYRCEIF